MVNTYKQLLYWNQTLLNRPLPKFYKNNWFNTDLCCKGVSGSEVVVGLVVVVDVVVVVVVVVVEVLDFVVSASVAVFVSSLMVVASASSVVCESSVLSPSPIVDEISFTFEATVGDGILIVVASLLSSLVDKLSSSSVLDFAGVDEVSLSEVVLDDSSWTKLSFSSIVVGLSLSNSNKSIVSVVPWLVVSWPLVTKQNSNRPSIKPIKDMFQVPR